MSVPPDHYDFSGNGNTRNQFLRTAFMERIHRPPFTTALSQIAKGFLDPLLFSLALARIAKGDGCLPQRQAPNATTFTWGAASFALVTVD